MAFRTDYSKYELTYGENGVAVDLCTGGGPQETDPDDLLVLSVETESGRLAITADSRAKFIFGVTLEGNFGIIRRKPPIYIDEACQMVMSKVFKEEYEDGEPVRVYFENNIVYIVIGDGKEYKIQYQTYDPRLEYTFQYDQDMKIRCIQLVLQPQQQEKFFGGLV